MAAEATSVLSRRGVDAPAFKLVAFGGAGPFIGALMAEEIYVNSVLIPPTPGAVSAFGAATSDVEGDMVYPLYRRLSALPPATLAVAWRDLSERVAAWIEDERSGIEINAITITWSMEMRYEGQGYDVNVALDDKWLRADDRESIARAFHQAHQARYGHASLDSGIRLQELRAHVAGSVEKTQTHFSVGGSNADAAGGVIGTRTIRLKGLPAVATIYERRALQRGTHLNGPAIIEQMDTTVLVPEGWRARVLASGSMVLENTAAIGEKP
jgi:N-methylhydantoinase A